MLPDLTALVREVTPDELPALVGRLREAELLAELRLRTPEPSPSAAHDGSGNLLTPDQAAEIASVPVKRIYDWARGKRWASRPTKRCVRIEETGFRKWLMSR